MPVSDTSSDSSSDPSSVVARSTATRSLKGRRILLLSAYDAHSHQQWRETLMSMFTEAIWTCLTLPPRYFAWRVRGNSLSWAFNHRDKLSDNHDLLIATSLCDLSSLRGFVPPLATLPTLVYCHENQFVYPANSQQQGLLEAQMLSLYTALCADRIAFNSQWNQGSFLEGVSQLLNKLPDHVPEGLPNTLRQRATVLPVPLPDRLFSHRPAAACAHPLNIVWNHRHEYDKGPALLLAIVRQLIQQGVIFRLHLLGQRFRQEPAEFAEISQLLAQHYQHHGIPPGHNGWMRERQAYEQLLGQADIVLSTAAHDFQGLSMLEATALGCRPVAPAALAYPEYLPADCLYTVNGLDITQQASAAVTTLLRQARSNHAPDVSQYSATALHAHWQALLSQLLTV